MDSFRIYLSLGMLRHVCIALAAEDALVGDAWVRSERHFLQYCLWTLAILGRARVKVCLLF
jgi:hypothetical protein